MKLIACFVVAILAVAAGWAGARQQNRTLTISLPGSVDPKSAMIVVGSYGGGLSLQTIQKPARPAPEGELAKPADRFDQTLHIGASNPVRVIVYVPGYEIRTHEFRADKDFGLWVFSPDLVKIPTKRVTLHVRGRNGAAAAHAPVFVTRTLIEAMSYFGYADGSVARIVLAEGQTDGSGTVTLNVPRSDLDPFVRAFREQGSAPVELSTNRLGFDRGTRFQPAVLPLHSPGNNPLDITLERFGTLKGRVLPSFYARNSIIGIVNASDDPGLETHKYLRFDAELPEGRGSYSAELDKNGYYSFNIPPGTYRMVFQVLGKGWESERRFVVTPIQRLGDGEIKLVDVP